MARRKKSTFEDLYEIAAKFPWWGGVLLAVISFAFLHYLAGLKVSPPSDLKNMTAPLLTQMLRGAAVFGQIILPVIFLIGAMTSFINQLKRKNSYSKVAAYGSQPADPLLEMSWRDFEGLVAEFFRNRGYSVKLTGGEGPDGGVDVVIKKGSDKYLVQCKQWKAQKVGVQIVRELYGVMAATGAAGGFVVTVGEFTSEAVEFSKGLNINLFNGARLRQMIQENHAKSPSEPIVAQEDTQISTIPSCPLCGEPLVLRTAQKGANIGQQFWGCSRFPHCRGTRSL